MKAFIKIEYQLIFTYFETVINYINYINSWNKEDRIWIEININL